MRFLLLISFILLNTSFCLSQRYLKVLSPTDRDIPFKQLAEKIDHYIDTATGENKKGNKQWKRKEWFLMHHLDKNGRLEDFGMKNLSVVNSLNDAAARSPQLLSNGGSWVSLGHYGVFGPMLKAEQGRVNCIAFHPTNPDIIYIGTAGGGIWKTGNGGFAGSWINISDNLPVTSFSGLAIASNGTTIYALTGEGLDPSLDVHEGVGVLKSDDGGNSWYQTGLIYTTSQLQGGYKIKIHPANQNIIIVANSDGLWRSQNAGATWTQLFEGEITDFEFKPDDSNVLYYSQKNYTSYPNTPHQGEIRKVNLTTLSETTLNLGADLPSTRIELAVSPASPNALYALAGPNYLSGSTWKYNGLYFSPDAGTSFSRRNNNEDVFGSGEQSWYDNVIYVNPTNADEVIIGGVRTYRSTDGGSTMSKLNTTNPFLHGDDHVIERNPLNGYLYLGDDGGIYKSTDNGLTWSNLSFNLMIGEYYRIAGHQGNNDLVLGGTQDNGQFLRTSNTGLFNNAIPGYDGMDNIIDHSNANIMYACIQNGGLYKSINGGADWGGVTIPGGGGAWITPILQSTSFPNTIFYGANSGVLRSTNGGTSWSNIGGYNTATAMAISNSGSRLIITDGEKIKISNNPNGASPTWSSEINPRSTITLNIIPISSIAINPANADDIMLSLSGYFGGVKVIRSTDGGINWSNYTINLPNIPIYAIAFGSSNNNPIGAVYIGTEIGVFYKDDNHAGWEPFFNGLPRVPVTDLFINYTTNDVTAATFGRGIWRTQGRTGCAVSQDLSNTISGNMFYQSSATINSSQEVPGSAGNSLKLRAGNTIRLIDGFKAKYGSYFQAINGPCGSNIQLPAQRSKVTNGKKVRNRKLPAR